MQLVKFLICVALTAWILLFLRFGKKSCRFRQFLVFAIAFGIALRVGGAALIYGVWPSLNYSSDPVRAYLVQARSVLEGLIPYRDFASSYSFLFAPVIAVPVFFWDSVGAIALFMSALEIGAMWAYLRRRGGAVLEEDLITVFIWVWFPSHFYWLSLAGYNSGMIAAGVMAAVVLAHSRRDFIAGAVSAVTFLATKLLALLFWPAVVLCDLDRRRTLRRAIPLVGAMAVLVLLAAYGADPLVPVRLEFNRSTSGTVWFYWWLLGAGLRTHPIYIYGPVVLFAIGFAFVLIRYWTHVSKRGSSFDASAAFIALTGLLFMVVSRKAYSFYLPMFLPFLLHTVVSSRLKRGDLPALALLGTFTTIEPYLWVQVRQLPAPISDYRTWLLLGIDTITIAIYARMIKVCWQRLAEETGRERVSASNERVSSVTNRSEIMPA